MASSVRYSRWTCVFSLFILIVFLDTCVAQQTTRRPNTSVRFSTRTFSRLLPSSATSTGTTTSTTTTTTETKTSTKVTTPTPPTTTTTATTETPETTEPGPPAIKEPKGNHVCSRRVYESGYYWVNRTYACWRYREVSCTSCLFSRCRKADGKCLKRRITQCSLSILTCVQRYINKLFCCPGYEQKDSSCVSSIRCQDNNGGCSQICRSDGLDIPLCTCFQGYQQFNKTGCVDLDECTFNNGGCDQMCRNTEGSYHCACQTGYQLETPHTCAEINECSFSNGGCAQRCINTDGAFYCQCYPGYVLANGFDCLDRNECGTFNGGCSDICNNTEGSFTCSCREENRMTTDNKTCEVIPTPAPVRQLPMVMVLGGTIGGVLLVLILLVILAICCWKTGCCCCAAAPSAEKKLKKRPILHIEDGSDSKKYHVRGHSNLGYKASSVRSGASSMPPPPYEAPPAYDDEGYLNDKKVPLDLASNYSKHSKRSVASSSKSTKSSNSSVYKKPLPSVSEADSGVGRPGRAYRSKAAEAGVFDDDRSVRSGGKKGLSGRRAPSKHSDSHLDDRRSRRDYSSKAAEAAMYDDDVSVVSSAVKKPYSMSNVGSRHGSEKAAQSKAAEAAMYEDEMYDVIPAVVDNEGRSDGGYVEVLTTSDVEDIGGY